MTKHNFGDKIMWSEEGDIFGKVWHKGIAIEIRTILEVVDSNGKKHYIDLHEVKKGWGKTRS